VPETATQSQSYPIPEKLNIVILLITTPLIWLLLWVASHLSIGWAILAALIFSQVNNTVFSLLHEAVHGIFSPTHFRNELCGHICAAMFPTSLRLQRVAHLGHHRRNRTDQDLYEYYLPGQSRRRRNFHLYAGNLLGFYWFVIPESNFIYLIAPWLYTSKWFIYGPARALGFEPYIKEIAQQGKLRIWLECLLAFSYQVLVFYLLDLNWFGWLLCYYFFALHWSALQYVDHAYSERDIINGAWNLKVSKPAQWLALNYHCHRAHHQHPDIPWIYLPKLVKQDDRRPSFWKIYFRMWGGAREAPPMGSETTI
jgi:fatty acid desaturase